MSRTRSRSTRRAGRSAVRDVYNDSSAGLPECGLQLAMLVLLRAVQPPQCEQTPCRLDDAAETYWICTLIHCDASADDRPDWRAAGPHPGMGCHGSWRNSSEAEPVGEGVPVVRRQFEQRLLLAIPDR